MAAEGDVAASTYEDVAGKHIVVEDLYLREVETSVIQLHRAALSGDDKTMRVAAAVTKF